jgi:hypothetical protein
VSGATKDRATRAVLLAKGDEVAGDSPLVKGKGEGSIGRPLNGEGRVLLSAGLAP